MSTGRKREKSKNDTWGEQELAKYIGGGKDATKKKLTSTDPRGSSRTNPKAKPSGTSSVRKDQTKASYSSSKSDPKKSSSSASKPPLEASSKRESKPPGGQSSGRSGGDKKREKEPKHREESRSKESKGQGRASQKESSSKRSSEKERSHGGSSRTSGQGGSKTSGSLEKQEHKQRSEKTKSQKDKDDSKPSSKEQSVESMAKPAPSASKLEQSSETKDNERGHPQPMMEVLEDLGEEDYQYEDEFEDEYEEDFDETAEEEDEQSSQSEEEGEVPTTPANADMAVIPSDSKAVVMKAMDLVEIMQAMDAENQMIEDSTSNVQLVPKSELPGDRSHDQELHGDRFRSGRGLQASPSRKFVDFSSAQRREVSEKVSKKTRKRGQELLSMIELDIAAYDMFDLPPLSEYEVYVKKFGTDDTRQVSVQTGEDNTECEVQTDKVECLEKWTQWPPEDLRGFGGPSLDSDELWESEVGREDALRLTSFLSRSGQVCLVLLEENILAFGGSSVHSTQSPFPFCSSSLTIQSPPYLAECQVTEVSHSPSQPHLFLAMYTPTTVDHTPLGCEGVVAVWSTRHPSQPQMVLVCQSQPTCTCFSPHKSSLVFAGNSDGSVVLWDLREPVSMHRREGGEESVVPRVPTFSTAGIPQLDNHHSPVVSITPISADTPTHYLLSQENTDSTGLSFQLATLDSAGGLHLWVVVEVLTPDPHGSDSDLGLVPLGRVKLIKSSTLDVTGGPAYCLQFRPGDTNHLYVGSDMGCIQHRTRYGKRPIPKTHTPNTECGSCGVLSISFCPWQPDLFLAGYSNGSVSLHHVNKVGPLLSWPYCVSGCVSLVQWIHHRPGVFLIQDSMSTIHLWDLLKNDAEPVYKHTYKDKFTCLSVNQPNISASSHLHTVTTSPAHTTHNPPTLTLAHTDGSIVVHQLKDSGKTSTDDKLLAFKNYLNRLF